MNYDKRLNMNIPSKEEYLQERDAKVSELENEYNNGDMDGIIYWISSIILTDIDDLKLNDYDKPNNIPPKFIKSIQEIEGVFETKESIINTNEPENIFLCKMIGKKIADLTGEQFELWDDVFQLIGEQHIIYDSWIKNLPMEVIKKNKKQLYLLPRYKHPLELIQTWGYLRDREYWESFSDNDYNNKKKSKDTWEYIDLSIDYNNEFVLGNELRFKSDLLQRLGFKDWILWVVNLPVIHIKNAAISEITSLDDAEEMTKILLNLKDYDNEKVEETIILIIRHTMDIYKRINDNLKHYSSDRWVYSDKDREYSAECKKQLDLWQSQELSSHLKVLIEALISEKVGKKIIIYMLRYLYVLDDKDFIIMRIREEIIHSLIMHNVPIKGTIEQIMEQNVNEKTMLNSLLLFFNYEDLEEPTREDILNKFWECYHVLLNDKFHWQVSLYDNNDNLQFLWTMACVLANLQDPVIRIKEILNKVYFPSEGWNYDSDKYYSSINKCTHCLIVGAMATEWLIHYNKLAIAKELFDFVWEYTHNWLRKITFYYPPVVDELLIQLWARLPLIHGDKAKKKVIRTMETMDDLSHMLLCNKIMIMNYRQDDENVQLDKEIKEVLEERFEELFPIVRAGSSFDKNKLEWYMKIVKEDLKLNVDI